MLSDTLKARTRSHHAAAEASPAMQAVMSDDLSRDAYRDHLTRLLAFYAPNESALAQVDGLDTVLPDLNERLGKAEWLRQDLDVLGTGDAAPHAHAPHLDVARALGTLYVIEGSTLGGRLIARQLESSVGVTADSGARFYLSYGENRGDRWKAYKSALNQFGADHPERADDVVEAASDAFDALRDGMAVPLAA